MGKVCRKLPLNPDGLKPERFGLRIQFTVWMLFFTVPVGPCQISFESIITMIFWKKTIMKRNVAVLLGTSMEVIKE